MSEHGLRIGAADVRSAGPITFGLIAGLSNEEFSSKLRRIPFPFSDEVTGSNLEIFHVSHGKWETAAPIRAFVPYDGGRSILASYTCTPVVHFPLADLAPGAKAVGRTVAELGAMNQPLDMVSFAQDGEEHLLVANSSHGLVKIACRDIDSQVPLTEPREPVGCPGKPRTWGASRAWPTWRQSRPCPPVRRRRPQAPAVAEDRLPVAGRVIERAAGRPAAVANGRGRAAAARTACGSRACPPTPACRCGPVPP